MIIIGYQGVGKSTLAGTDKFIDLESGNFWNNGERPDNWYVYYCNIANDLSSQGYKVFTSSHEAVRNRLRKYSKEDIYTVTPDISLKDKWVQKLYDRWKLSNLEKDYKAYINAEDRYTENINEILDTPFKHIILEDMDYDLKDILYRIGE